MLKTYFQISAHDDTMHRLRGTRRRRSRSFVHQFLELMYQPLTNGLANAVNDITSTTRSLTAGNDTFYVALLSTAPGRAGASQAWRQTGHRTTTPADEMSSSSNNGIVVGTGTTAVTPTDMVLATPIADGTASGQLEYFPCGASSFTVAAPTASFKLERLFRNSSGGTITLNEVGIYSACGNRPFFLTDHYHFCIIRDLVSPGFAISNGEYARIQYTLSVTA